MSMLRIKKSSKIEGNICFSNLNINIIILNKCTFAIGSNFSSRKMGSVCALNGADLIILSVKIFEFQIISNMEGSDEDDDFVTIGTPLAPLEEGSLIMKSTSNRTFN